MRGSTDVPAAPVHVSRRQLLARIQRLSDDALIDAYHHALLNIRAALAGNRDRDSAYLISSFVEAVMADRFGHGEHFKRYRDRYPPPRED
jgi:hypothetical protein